MLWHTPVGKELSRWVIQYEQRIMTCKYGNVTRKPISWDDNQKYNQKSSRGSFHLRDGAFGIVTIGLTLESWDLGQGMWAENKGVFVSFDSGSKESRPNSGLRLTDADAGELTRLKELYGLRV